MVFLVLSENENGRRIGTGVVFCSGKIVTPEWAKGEYVSGAAPGKKSSRSMRQYPRFQLDVRMLVHLFREGGNVTVWGRSTSLGQEGIGATLTGEMEVGEVVGLEFSVPLCPHPLKLRAIVRYKNGFQYGFEFLAVDGNQRQAIQRAVDILQPML